MPRRSKGPRLWLQPARRGVDGKIIEQAVWVIRDGSVKRSTGCGSRETERAEKALRDYLNAKPTKRIRDRDPAAVLIADVIAIYTEDVASKHARPKETAARLARVLDVMGDKTTSRRAAGTSKNVGRKPPRAANLRTCAPPFATIGKPGFAPH